MNNSNRLYKFVTITVFDKNGMAAIWLSLIVISWSCSVSKNTGRESIHENSFAGVLHIDGFPLKYIRRGTGDPVLVIGSADYYSKAFSRTLENHFEMFYIDSRHFVPGCRIADEKLKDIGLSTFSEDVDTIRKYLNLDKVAVIGHSVHAQIALDYAFRYPQQVTKLILICGVPYTMSQHLNLRDSLWKTEATEDRKNRMTANNLVSKNVLDTTPADRQFAVSYYYNAPLYWADPAYDATSLLQNIRTCPRLMGKLFGIVPDKETAIQKLKSLNMPILVVHGKLDYAAPYTAWQELIQVNPRIKFVLMNKASHNPQTEESTAEAFNRHLLSWDASTK